MRAGEVGGAHYPKWRRSLLIRAETRDVGLEKNDRLGTMHTSDHRRSVWYFLRGARSFTEEEEEEEEERRRIMMTKIQISHMTDFSCGETKVRNDP